MSGSRYNYPFHTTGKRMVASLTEHLPTKFPNTYFDVVALAASAGGLHAFSEVIRRLPANFPAAVLVIQHLAPNRESLLTNLIKKSSALSVRQAEEGAHLEPGIVYTAPPDFHMLVNGNGCIHLNQNAPVNFTRPAADPLFESIAAVYRNRVMAVILSGMGSDGSKGVLAVNASGGKVIVQSLDTSEYTGMPGAAIRTGKADYVLPLEEIPSAIVSLVTTGECS